MHPADKNLTNLAIKIVLAVLHSTAASLTTEHAGIFTCTTRMQTGYCRGTFYTQNPAFEIVEQQSVKVLCTHVLRKFSRTLNA